MKCLINRCPNGFTVCCQTCECKFACDSVCEIKRACQARISSIPKELEIAEPKKDKPLTLIISILILLMSILLLGAMGNMLTMQTDTLNTLMGIETQIDDLSDENTPTEEVFQSEEKTLQMDADEPVCTYLGEYTITYYCGCEACCGKTDGITKLGTTATVGRTVGADWNVIAPTTKIYIEGIGERVVEDTGGGIQGNHIDVFVDSHEEALKLGRTTRKVYEVN